jgi:hypothetical protein
VRHQNIKKDLLLDLGIFFLLLDREGTGVAGGVVTVEASFLMHAVLYLWHCSQVTPIWPLLWIQV